MSPSKSKTTGTMDKAERQELILQNIQEVLGKRERLDQLVSNSTEPLKVLKN